MFYKQIVTSLAMAIFPMAQNEEGYKRCRLILCAFTKPPVSKKVFGKSCQGHYAVKLEKRKYQIYMKVVAFSLERGFA